MFRLVLAALVAVPIAFPVTGQQPLPIIDMHLHANGADDNGPPPTYICPGYEQLAHDPRQPWMESFTALVAKPRCANPIVGSSTDEAVLKETLAVLERRNIIGVTSGPRLDQWRSAGGDRLIPSLMFNLGPNTPSPATMAEWFKAGRYQVFGEVGIQYQGVSPSDARFEPYLAVAEAADVPVGIHIGIGPPGAPYFPGLGNYRAKLHSALELEDALVRHPKLRVYVMHAGWPMIDDLLAVLWAHPQVHIDTGAIIFALPRAEFYRLLQRVVEAGFGSRVLFGSDQMNWPGVVDYAIETIESAPFLSATQKRDILYNNAARFLRLTKELIDKHHGR